MAVETNWTDIRGFFEEECKWDSKMKQDAYDGLCNKYGFASATNGWILPEEIKSMPNLANDKIHEEKPDIRRLFKHYHSFIAENGEIYWTVSPDDLGMDGEEIAQALNANYLLCDIVDGIRSSYTLVFKPINVVIACGRYEIKQNVDQKYELQRINTLLEQCETIGRFETLKEAEAFKIGFDVAYAQVIAMMANMRK